MIWLGSGGIWVWVGVWVGVGVGYFRAGRGVMREKRRGLGG